MATSFSFRRLLLIGGFAVAAAAAPALAVHAMPTPGAAVAQCSSGEEQDEFTTTCTPYLVPRSGSLFSTTAANPDVPEIQGIPCIGHNAGACLGLAENEADAGPQPIPQSTISSSP
ncbi:intersectin-EH binding protein Ibp1 [Mycobacterium deserti]|uniref:Intersectin-EH binding protein Ibp1 n=1 Tax=Mycobacterium deserti TaxID=2978347 RepID=A0ABT2M667_9MYCO|nr:intersectin-EH binding protein Ibp1 [Mycobacterium deserti]MCT7657758.1 intersectin-EH binding protein Ibp1 [Mycobacterium deserti]